MNKYYKHYHKDIEESRRKQREWYYDHKEERAKSAKNYKQKHEEHWRIYKNKNAKENLQKRRDELFEFIGYRCQNSNCPIPPEKLNKDCLTIDHINNGGYAERKKIKYRPTYYKTVLDSLKKGEKKYQILCIYCNWLKGKKDGKI